MKHNKKIVLFLLVFVMIFTMVPSFSVSAASKIKLNKTSATVYTKNNITLKVSGTSKSVKWSSSNKKIATVTSKGKITGIKKGVAYIYAKVGGKTYKCKVNVKSPYLNKTSTKIFYNSKYTLKLTGAKIKSIKSSNSKVATVSKKGVVTAKKAGKATITVIDTNKKTYKCFITVKGCSHNWNGKKKVVAATCDKDGYTQYSCSKCGTTKKETIKSTGHNYSKSSIIKAATYTTTGTKRYTCSKCGKTKDEVIPVLVCSSHSWDSGVVTKEATCKEAGVKTYTCTKCGEIRTEDIIRVPHNYVWVTSKDATTTSEGLKEHKCSKCGDVDATESIPKLTLETDWVYSGDTRTKTMADGTSFTETKYSTSSGVVWGFYDDAAASQMFTEIQNMQRQAYGEANVAVWDESQIGDAKLMAAKYAACGISSKLFHSSSGGFPNVSDNRKYITFTDSYGLGLAISCFVFDSRGGSEQFTYGDDWRTYFGTYYSSAF